MLFVRPSREGGNDRLYVTDSDRVDKEALLDVTRTTWSDGTRCLAENV